MRRLIRDHIEVMGFGVLGLFALYAYMAFTHTILVNVSGSLPRGLYVKTSRDVTSPKLGQIVLFCGPSWTTAYSYVRPSRRCGPGEPTLMKFVAGTPGMSVAVKKDHVVIDGRGTEATLLAADSKGRTLPRVKDGVVPPGFFFPLATFNTRSLDGRYVGVISDKKILGAYACVVCEAGLKAP